MKRALVALIAAGTLANCANNGNPANICSDPPVPYFSMLYPPRGATNVPDNTTQAVFDGELYSGNPPPSVVVSANGQTIAAITTFTSSAILVGEFGTPPPAPAPTGPYLTGTLPPLSAHTTYTLTYDYTQSQTGPCGGLQTQTLGSFTTQ